MHIPTNNKEQMIMATETIKAKVITQQLLNDGPALVLDTEQVNIWAEQTGTKGLYVVDVCDANGLTLALEYIEGIAQVRETVALYS